MIVEEMLEFLKKVFLDFILGALAAFLPHYFVNTGNIEKKVRRQLIIDNFVEQT